MERVKLRELRELNLLDKFLFDEAMEDRETYQMAVSILMENEVEFLEKPETEKELRVSSEIRQVRLDVVGMDKKGNIYYAEMQKRNTGNLIRRSRYYQAQLDVSLLEPGSMDFNLLNDSLFIMIAPFDIFGRGLYRYTFEEVCRIRKSEKAGIKYMQRWEELEYAKQDGREEGIKENALNTAKRMLEDGKLTMEKIAEYAGLSLDEVKRL